MDGSSSGQMRTSFQDTWYISCRRLHEEGTAQQQVNAKVFALRAESYTASARSEGALAGTGLVSA